MLEALPAKLQRERRRRLAMLRTRRKLLAVVRRSPSCGCEENAIVARIARSLGLRRIPDVRRSAEIDVPQVTGILSPAVLLPAGVIEALTPVECEMALMGSRRHPQPGGTYCSV